MIIDVYLPDGRYVDRFGYDESFMVSLQDVPPIERGLMIYEKTLETNDGVDDLTLPARSAFCKRLLR